jgi:hypothetical protein
VSRPTKKVPVPQARPTKKVQPKHGKVRVKFQKAGRSPSQRKKSEPHYADSVIYFNGRNPLNRYIVENEDSGLSIAELTEQFQEFDCVHHMEHFATAFHTGEIVKEYRCAICYKTERKVIPT